jgi:hypothetical protein
MTALSKYRTRWQLKHNSHTSLVLGQCKLPILLTSLPTSSFPLLSLHVCSNVDVLTSGVVDSVETIQDQAAAMFYKRLFEIDSTAEVTYQSTTFSTKLLADTYPSRLFILILYSHCLLEFVVT